MALTYKQIISEIEKKNYAPVYFLTGEEPYYIDYISDYIEKYVIPEDLKDFNQTILYGRDTNIKELLLLAKAYPMMSDHRVIIVKEAQELGNLEGLESYIDNPLKSNILVFCYKHKKLDQRTKLGKAIALKTVFFDRKKMYDYQLPGWIEDFVAEKGFSITAKAAALVAESLGNDLTKIANEFSKIFINISKGTTINEAIIEENIGISKDFNVFELQKAIIKKDILKANQIINYFEDNPKDHPIQMNLSVLYAFFIKIMIYHQVQDKSNKFLVSSVLGVNAFFIEDYANASKVYSLSKLAQIIGWLKETDLKSKGIKNNSVSPGDLMKEFIFKVLH